MSKKPLGIKNYGSIPHLPNSRLGPGDHSCHEGQARIATEQMRDRHDKVIVQEKLDGSNVGVAKINGQIVPLTRAGYRAETSPYKQHHLFADWVMHPNQHRRFREMLFDGERVVGEWLAQAHGTRYELNHHHDYARRGLDLKTEPFVAFDLFRGNERVTHDEFINCVCGWFVPAYTLPYERPLSIDEVMKELGTYGKHGAVDPIEGAVWRVERMGKVDFLVKWVRPDKVDGRYLEAITGGQPVWNWQPVDAAELS